MSSLHQIRSQVLSRQHWLGSSAAHQRISRPRFHLDKCVRDRGSKSVSMASPRSSIQQLNTQLQCSVPVHWPTVSHRSLLALSFSHKHLEGGCMGQKKPFYSPSSISFCPCWSMNVGWFFQTSLLSPHRLSMYCLISLIFPFSFSCSSSPIHFDLNKWL